MSPTPNRRLVEETVTRRVYREDLDDDDDTDGDDDDDSIDNDDEDDESDPA